MELIKDFQSPLGNLYPFFLTSNIYKCNIIVDCDENNYYKPMDKLLNYLYSIYRLFDSNSLIEFPPHYELYYRFNIFIPPSMGLRNRILGSKI